MRVLVACGGTGGHVNPGLAIAGILQAHCPDIEFLFVGTPSGMESELVPKAGYPMAHVQVAGFQRSMNLHNLKRNLKAVGYLMTAGSICKKILKDFKPDLAIGTGGYVSGPVIRAAQQMDIPTVIHEQNAYPGVTNKLLAPKAKAVMLTFAAAKELFPAGTNTVLTGLPVRGGMMKPNREQARMALGIHTPMTILSFGGSQGAKCLNDQMPDLMAWHLASDMQIHHIHAYGKHGRDSFLPALQAVGVDMQSERLRVSEYIHDMPTCLAAADLVISRAGASTISELEAVGRASVLIPYPNAAENHQYHNAMVLGKAGAAVVIAQKDLTQQRLREVIAELYANPAKLQAMGQRAGALYAADTNDRIWQVLEPLCT